MTRITAKQTLFVSEYLLDLNATQAAIRAGYSERTANRIGAENLSKPVIQQAIAAALESRSERLKADSDLVLSQLVEILEMDVLDILNDDGSLKPIKKWPKIWRQFISSCDVQESVGNGEGAAVAITKKVRWPDKLKILELIGRHVDAQAWKERKEVELGDETRQTLRDIIRSIDGTGKGLPSCAGRG